MTAHTSSATTPTTEEYLEIIYMMNAEGRIVKGARLAEIIGVSRPTVTATLRRMTRDGLIQLNAKKEVELTTHGYTVADTLQRRHRIIERWLTDGLQFDWAKSDAESHRLEHVFSDEVIERLNDQLGRPETCPHGNPIPGNQRPGSKNVSFPLSQSSEGDRVRVCPHFRIRRERRRPVGLFGRTQSSPRRNLFRCRRFPSQSGSHPPGQRQTFFHLIPNR